MIGYFYDIECLDNVFSLVNFREDKDECDVFYLIDNEEDILQEEIVETIEPAHIDEPTGLYVSGKTRTKLVPVNEARLLELLTAAIYEGNEYFHGKVNMYDLHDMDANAYLARTFGLSDAVYINLSLIHI